MKVILHPGFPKTGTTSLQHFLRTNRRKLAPYVEVFNPGDMKDLKIWGRRYGRYHNAVMRTQYRRTVRGVLARCGQAPVAFISWEGLAGPAPGLRILGRETRNFHERAIPVISVFLEEIRARWASEPLEIQMLMTTRDRDAWIRSAYGLLLRVERIQDDFDGFCARLGAFVPDLDEEAARIASAFPDVDHHVIRLEDAAAWPEGPARAVLDLAGVPDDVRQTLRQPPARNTSISPSVRAALLALNRSGGSPFKRRRAKVRIVRRHKRKIERKGRSA